MNIEQRMTDGRAAWLAAPIDLHYRGELAELGIRVVDAQEQELIRNSQIRMEGT
jgi:hypothetical protein